MEKNKMNIGVIGAGYWGKKVVGEYLDLASEGIIDSVGICDAREDVLNTYKNNDAVNILERDYKKFVLDEGIDAVHICVNNNNHYMVANEALEHETNVLLEKPMTTTSREAYKLLELSAQYGLILQVGHIFRFANVIRKAKDLIETNYFGNRYYLTMKWTTLMNPMEGVDIIWDLLPHPLDMLHFLTGEWPIDWQVLSRAYRRKSPSEIALIHFIYDDFIADIELSWITPERKRLMEIIGSKRSAKIECVKQNMHIFEGNNKDFDMEIQDNNTIRDEALNFINSIKNQKMPFNSHIIGAKNVDIIEKIMESL
jgi:predicted dehydrogenase